MSQLLPGSSIGIIGGHPQISSIVLMAKRLGYRIHHFREEDEAKILLADQEVIGRYQDRQALFNFAMHVDTVYILTNAIEIDTIVALSGKSRYYQSFELAEISQNRMVEKLFLEEHAINVAPYGMITSIGELPSLLSSIGFPAKLETNRFHKKYKGIMLYDHDMDDQVFQLVEEQSCMVTAFVPAQRHFSITILRDYEDHITILPITEDIYIDGTLKYSIASKRMNPEWVGELRTIASKMMRSISGSTLVSIQVVMAKNGIFYITKVDQIPLIQHQFSSKQMAHSFSEVLLRLSTGLGVLECSLVEEALIVPIYPEMLEKAHVLTILKPHWEFEYFQVECGNLQEAVGVIRLTGASSVDLVNELELSGLHD